jgi:hypothetical protein
VPKSGPDAISSFNVWVGLMGGQVDHVSVPYSSLGDNVVCKPLHIQAPPLKDGHFHAAFLIEMYMQCRLSEVVVLMEIACQPLRQFARFMIVDVDQCRHARARSADLHGRLLQAAAGEVPDRL